MGGAEVASGKEQSALRLSPGITKCVSWRGASRGDSRRFILRFLRDRMLDA